MKKLLLILSLSTAPIYVWAEAGKDNGPGFSSTTASESDTHKSHSDQVETVSSPFPNYGGLVVDWGFNCLRNSPSKMGTSFWQSRFINVYFFYNIRLGSSRFTISPGIGLAFDGYQFEDGSSALVRDDTGDRNTIFKKTDELFPRKEEFVASSLDVRYLDFLVLEARFNANNECPKEGFFAALGLKLGLRWNASTTIKYKEDDMIKTQHNVESFNLQGMRAGLHARFGWGRFGLCYTHILSNLFKEDKGPENTTAKPFHIGISIDLL
ncbi:MAG: PorT family protein [Amoebophilaceae bacterium]|nr:PorT family protein [Amoebophilaceae bacterium]